MFKWLRKNERGSVMVIVALSMVVLLGFSGLAVDFGGMAMTKQELQNAADAAALAAGQDRANGYGTATATATANAFIQANGFTPGDGVTVSNVTFGSNTVTVTISTEYDVALASILTGRSTETVNVKAVVDISTGFAHFPYAMFAGEHINDGGSGITGNGNDMTINGNIHSNSKITMSHAVLNGTATAVDAININGVSLPESIFIEMPSAQPLIDLAKTGYVINGDVNLKKNDGGFAAFIEEAAENTTIGPYGLNIYVAGNLKIRGDDFYNNAYPINLVVYGTIDLGGTPIRSTPTTPVNLISVAGSIEVNGQGTTGGAFYGLFFAGNGNVTLNGGNESHYAGSIYAQNITKNGAGLTVSYNSEIDDHLPKGKVRLIE